MRTFGHSLAAFGFALWATTLPAQESPIADSVGTVIRSNVREVVLDVVARRKNLSLATRLKASDFTITEDGVPQTIRSFRLIGGREARVIALPPQPVGGSADSIGTRPISGREPNFVSIVFDQMGIDSRRNAVEAATDFLDQEFQDNTQAAVFRLNVRLNAIQGFTHDRAALRAAVRKAVNGNAKREAIRAHLVWLASKLDDDALDHQLITLKYELMAGSDPALADDVRTRAKAIQANKAEVEGEM
jgi:VWFA-related protein